MFETRSLAVDIESKLNALAEELKTQCRFKITDNVQDYESYIKLINNDEEFNYIPGVLEVISPIVPSTRVGVYTATYKLSLYGFTDIRSDVEKTCNAYASNFSETIIDFGDEQIGLSIGGLSIPRALIGSQDGHAELGDRFEGNILINVQISLNASLNLGSEAKLFIDNIECQYLELQFLNEKSLLNTSYEIREDKKLVSESLSITFPFLKSKYLRFSLIDNNYVQDINGAYLKTLYNGIEIYYLESGQNYSCSNGQYVADDCGEYILTSIDGELIYIVPNPVMVEDINGSSKINELFSFGIANKYNIRNHLKLVFPQHIKIGYYNYRNFTLIYNKNNEPIAFTVTFDISFDRRILKIDDTELNILSFNFANVSEKEIVNRVVSKNEIKSVHTTASLKSSGKGFTIIFEHDHSEKSTQLINEGINELFGTKHSITVNIKGCDSNPSLAEITKTYNVFIADFKFANAENPAMVFEITFAELGE